jgi:hypothetical protein
LSCHTNCSAREAIYDLENPLVVVSSGCKRVIGFETGKHGENVGCQLVLLKFPGIELVRMETLHNLTSYVSSPRISRPYSCFDLCV